MVREHYRTLGQHKLDRSASYYRVEAEPLPRVTLDSPAVEVMTDLKRIQAITIGPDASLKAVNQAMMRNTVRSLLVADEKRRIIGIITSTDTLGEKPMQIVRGRGIRHEDVRARDIMTPGDQLEVIAYADVLSAEVGHVVATLKASGRQHALVAERDETGQQRVRGIFSTSRIALQLGSPIHPVQPATTFAEIEAALGR